MKRIKVTIEYDNLYDYKYDEIVIESVITEALQNLSGILVHNVTIK